MAGKRGLATGMLGAACLGALLWTASRKLEGLVGEFGAEVRRQQRLEADLQESLRLVEQQRQVAREVLAGRLNLLQAAAVVGALEKDLPPRLQMLAEQSRPGVPAEERLCRGVIGAVVGELQHNQPRRARAWEQHLRAELRRHLRRGSRELPAESAAGASHETELLLGS
jgi:hypothetical protein